MTVGSVKPGAFRIIKAESPVSTGAGATKSETDAKNNANVGPDVQTKWNTKDDTLLGCLVYLSKLFEQPVSRNRLADRLAPKGDRLSPSELVEVAEEEGFTATMLKQPLKRLLRGETPVILLLNNATGCVLLGSEERGRATIMRPDLDERTFSVTTKRLARYYSGYAIKLRESLNFYEPVKPERRRLGAWFWGTIFRHWWIFSQVVLASVFVNVFALTSSIFVMTVYDRVIPNKAFNTLWALALGVGVVLAFEFVLRMLRFYFIEAAGRRADAVLAGRLFQHVLDIKLRHRPQSTGILAGMIREYEALREFFTAATLASVIDLPFVFLFIFVVGLLGGWIVVVLAAAAGIILIMSLAVQLPLKRSIEQAAEDGRRKTGLLFDALGGLETVKSLGAAPRLRQRWEHLVEKSTESGNQSRKISQSVLNAASIVHQLTTVALVTFGVYLIDTGSLTMGALIACVILGGRTLAPLTQIAQLLIRYQQSRAALSSLSQIMDLPADHEPGRKFLHRPDLNGKFEMREVSFKYSDEGMKVLDHVSFTIEPGERVCILGRVGSGKSTLLRLLMGLYEPTDGVVLVDDTDTRQIDPLDLRAQFGCVLQDTYLFSGTLRENIALGANQASDADILNAASVASVHEFARRHPFGYDMPVGERGEGLSGGQRQAVAIARAILRDPTVLIMDEPTSAMDQTSEIVVRERLAGAIEGRTVIFATHRTSLLTLATRVIVIEGGRVALDCSRDEFIAKQTALRSQRAG